ncbi:biotin-independent malonate decarboxylase subunit gamma [Acidocella facilis]|nr:biotin-independent malonate decarboxylase subunit gamma [Acidocella facilis]
MTRDELLTALFPAGCSIQPGGFGTLRGMAELPGTGRVEIIGIEAGTPLGIEGALILSGHVLDLVAAASRAPLLVLVDTAAQEMARREELLGLNEALAHLAKSLALAAETGMFTLGLLYGRAAAGAFIATALSTQMLVALPDAYPSVMDLPSIARVTKLKLETLEALAQTTPIFAPGLEPLFATGAIAEIWPPEALAARLAATLAAPPPRADTRDALGQARGGRKRAHDIAAQVMAQAAAHG